MFLLGAVRLEPVMKYTTEGQPLFGKNVCKLCLKKGKGPTKGAKKGRNKRRKNRVDPANCLPVMGKWSSKMLI